MDQLECRRIRQLGAEVSQLFVNGRSLPEALAQATGIGEYSTSVPSWLCWPEGATDGSSIGRDVRSRTELTLEPSGRPSQLPILLCPDDLDFSCTTIVVEVSATDEVVTWRRFGIDEAPFRVDRWRAGSLDGPVRWFDSSPTYRFEGAAYRACVGGFNA